MIVQDIFKLRTVLVHKKQIRQVHRTSTCAVNYVDHVPGANQQTVLWKAVAGIFTLASIAGGVLGPFCL